MVREVSHTLGSSSGQPAAHQANTLHAHFTHKKKTQSNLSALLHQLQHGQERGTTPTSAHSKTPLLTEDGFLEKDVGVLMNEKL